MPPAPDRISKRAIKSGPLDAALQIATVVRQSRRTPPGARHGKNSQFTDTLQAVEDRDFARHFGIDVGGMLRALFVTVKSGGETKQGASTLTQQLARSGLLGIGKEQTLSRKFNEILYALLIEARYDKSTILEAYLNQVYLGQRGSQAIHGVAAGSEFWFGRGLDDLSTEQNALLVAIVKGPSAYDPRRHPEKARLRRDFVLSKMLETQIIDQAEYQRRLKRRRHHPVARQHAAIASRLCRLVRRHCARLSRGCCRAPACRL